jgi:membrane protein
VTEVEPVSGKSLWDLIKQTASSWSDINAPRLGAALAFYTLLSIAPLLVVCIGIAGLIFGAQAAQDQIAAQIANVVGWQNAETLQALLQHANKPAAGIAATVVGFLTLLFGASGVFGELRDSMNLVWGVKGTSGSGIVGMIKYRFVSFAMVLGIGFLLLVSLVLSAGIAAAGKFLQGRMPIPEPALHLTSTAVTFITVTVLFALLYKFVPDAHIEWGDVAIGAGVTSALFSIGKFLIALYLGKASVGSAYGAAGSLVVFIVWVYYSAQIFFLGAEFTHVFAERHGSIAKERAGVEDTERKREVNRFRHPKLA